MIKSYFWIIPFFSCLIGYLFVDYLMISSVVVIPAVVSKNIHQAVKELSQAQLVARIIQERTDNKQLPGTVLFQHPAPSRKVRKNTIVDLIVVSCQEEQLMPALQGQHISNLNIQDTLEHQMYALKSVSPHGQIIAQFPSAQTTVKEKAHLFYAQSGTIKVVPCLLALDQDTAVELCRMSGLEPVLLYEDGSKLKTNKYTVVEQRPLPGTVIDNSKEVQIQLKISI